MSISSYFNCFCLFSFLGWLYECTYCSIKEKHWENRGFLFGPVCPIYGVGVVTCLVLFGVIPVSVNASGISEAPVWEIFVICAIGSAIIEYVTSFILEKVFNSRWWDYSAVPLNLNGRICLPATLAFGVAGIVVVRYIAPIVMAHRGHVNPIASEAISLLLMFMFGADFALTVASLTSLIHKLETAQRMFDNVMENGYQALANTLDFRELYLVRNIRIYSGSRKNRDRIGIRGYYDSFKGWFRGHERELIALVKTKDKDENGK